MVGRQVRVTGLGGRWAWSSDGPGLVASLVWWRSGLGGGQDIWRGTDLHSKEFSGVNITKDIQPIAQDI